MPNRESAYLLMMGSKKVFIPHETFGRKYCIGEKYGDAMIKTCGVSTLFEIIYGNNTSARDVIKGDADSPHSVLNTLEAPESLVKFIKKEQRAGKETSIIDPDLEDVYSQIVDVFKQP